MQRNSIALLLIVFDVLTTQCCGFRVLSLNSKVRSRRAPVVSQPKNSKKVLTFGIVCRTMHSDDDAYDHRSLDKSVLADQLIRSLEGTKDSLDEIMLNLGYSAMEAETLKASVVSQIKSLGVRRPVGALPEMWIQRHLRNCTVQYPAIQSASTMALSKRTKPFLKPRVTVSEFFQSGGGSTSFSWRTNSTAVHDAKILIDSDELPVVEAAEHHRHSAYVSDALIDFDSDNGELNFLPTLPEFKAMLLQESRFRMRIVGNWIAPLLRLENKFRYKVYRGFLTFLDTGLSDVVERVVSALESDDSYEGTDDMDLDDEFD